MPKTPNIIDASLCPLCQQENGCNNLLSCRSGDTCWCAAPEIQFSDKLLAKIPNEAKNKACVCKACALASNIC